MSDTNKIVAALAQLNFANANHWTSDGLPRLDTLKMLAGDPALTREQVTAAAPGYSREQRVVDIVQQPSAPAAVAPTAGSDDHGADGAGSPAAQGEADSSAGQGTADEAIAAAQAELSEWKLREARAKRAVAEATAALDLLLEAREKSGTAVSGAATIQEYLKSQQRQREQRGARIAELKGIPLKDILPKPAPIDAAFARKNGQGQQRPRR